MESSSQHAKNLLFLHPSKIFVNPNRGRKDFSSLGELVKSIQEQGLIHPLAVQQMPDGRYELIAGECRYRAMCLLGWKELPCTDRTNLSALEIKCLELEENLCRAQLNWEEECELYRQIDEVKRQIYGEKLPGTTEQKGWTTKDTAKSLGAKRSMIYCQIQFAKKLNANPNLREEVKNLPLTAAIKKVEMIEKAERNKRLYESGQLKINAELKLGDCQDLIKAIPSSSIDLLLTDIPYGVAAVNEALNAGGKSDATKYKQLLEESDNLTKDRIISIMANLLPELRRVLKPASHFYIFHSFAIYPELIALMKSNDFLVFDTPIIWDKGKTTSAFKGYEYSACYEPILYGHIPPKSKRFNESCKLILNYPSVSSEKRLHSFEKPQDLLKFLITQSTNVGERIIDPFSGSAATLVAAKELKRSCIGFEISEKNYNVSLERLK